MDIEKETISIFEAMKVAVRTIPSLPSLVRNTRAIKKLNVNDYISIGLLFEEITSATPNKTFLIFEGREWTYLEFNCWVNRIANLLKSKHVKSGDCVGIMFENRPALIACVLATVKLGAIAGMINYNQQGNALSYSLNLIKPKVVIVGEECSSNLDQCLNDLVQTIPLFWEGEGTCPATHEDLNELCRGHKVINPPETKLVTLGQPCYYVFTSGTTGLPKAAEMSHYRWYKGAIGFGRSAMRLKSDDVLYCPLPFYHNNALTVAMSSVLSAGATLALGRKFSARNFWGEVNQVKATSFIYIGEICRYLLSQPKSAEDKNNRVRVIVGNGIRPEIWHEFKERFGIKHICEFYGASESNLAFVNVFNIQKTAGFSPMNYTVVEFDHENEEEVVQPDGYLRRVPRGKVGLLLSEVSEENPFEGYTDEDATESKLRRNVFKQGDVWFNTGDLVRDQGFRHISFVDRVGDTFRWKGENIATTEIEGVLHRHPDIQSAVVYGVSIPDNDGRAGMAAITLVDDSEADLQALYQYLASALPSYAIPLFLRIREVVETTATFKVNKVALKQQAFNPEALMLKARSDQLYFTHNLLNGYQTLDIENYKNILRGGYLF